jgi:hypothetical protein
MRDMPAMYALRWKVGARTMADWNEVLPTAKRMFALGARRRRSGGGPGGGCASRPVGTYLYLHAVGAGNPIAVPCLAR